MKNRTMLLFFCGILANATMAFSQSQHSEFLPQDTLKSVRDSMLADSVKLGEVIIQGKKRSFKWDKKGILVADIRNSDLRNEIDLNSVLRRIPGLWMTGGTIEMPGRKAPVYYINDRKVQQQYEIEMLSVKDIDKIQVIISPGPEYDSDGAPVIVIETKNIFDGIMVQINPTVTYSDKWSDKENINVAYHDEKNLDLYFSYRHNNAYVRQEDNSQQINLSDTIWRRTNVGVNTQRTYSHVFQTGVNYRFQSWILGLKYDTSFGKSNDRGSSSFVLTNNKQTEDFLSGNEQSESSSIPKYHHANLFLSRTIGDYWRLKLAADYVHQNNSGEAFTEELFSNKYSDITYSTDNRWNIFAGQFTATYKKEAVGEMSIGGNLSVMNGRNQTDYAEYLENNSYVRMRENKYSFFLSYNRSFGNLGVTAGIRYEWLLARSVDAENRVLKDEAYPNWRPSLSLTYSTNKGIMHLFNYSLSVKRPLYEDMSDGLRYINRFNYTMGNLNLRPASDHDFNYTFYWDYFYANLSYIYSHKSLLSEISLYPGKSYAVIQRAINEKDSHSLILNANYRYPIKFWEPSIGFLCYKTFFEYKVNGEKKQAGMPIMSLSFANVFRLPRDFRLSLTYQQYFKGDFYYMVGHSSSSVDVELQKTFLKDKLQCSLRLTDVFDKQRIKGTGYYNQVISYSQRHTNTRGLGISIVYRFNQSLSKHEYESENAASDETRRLKNVEE